MGTLLLLLLTVAWASCGSVYRRQWAPDASCAGRCDQVAFDVNQVCQCNVHCRHYDDCCRDFTETCELEVPQPYGVTNTELRNIAETLWGLDANRLPDDQFTINSKGDKFFKSLNENYFNKPTFKKFIALLDNYIPQTGIAEPKCDPCREEEDAFLEEILETPVMQRAWEFLVDRGLASYRLSGFRDELKQYWFQQYKRGSKKGILDSSGFEHTFVGEIKSNEVTGFHGWVQFYLEEKSNDLQLVKRKRSCVPNQETAEINWLGYNKPSASMFMGVSPEFEMALYTICFLSRVNQSCNFYLDGKSATITSYTMTGVSPKTIGTAYIRC